MQNIYPWLQVQCPYTQQMDTWIQQQQQQQQQQLLTFCSRFVGRGRRPQTWVHSTASWLLPGRPRGQSHHGTLQSLHITARPRSLVHVLSNSLYKNGPYFLDKQYDVSVIGESTHLTGTL